MKILSVGYYDDFARFFLSIKKENPKLDFLFLNLYFSGYFYLKLRLQPATFFSFTVWLNKIVNRKKYLDIINKKKYKNVDLDKIIKYHHFLNENNEVELKLQAVSYIDKIDEILSSFKPDFLLLSGDSRLSIEVFDIIAKDKNINIYYFEQGPFGTTIFDKKGVNANASIRKKVTNNDSFTLEAKEKRVNNFFSRPRKPSYKRNPAYRASDYILQYLLSKVGLLPIDIIMETDQSTPNKYYKSINTSIQKEKSVFLLILQVPYDVNMVYHSPFYRDHYSIVKDVYSNLPEKSQLIIREHPLYKEKYENELYEFMSENNISMDSNNLYDSIDNSKVVIVNNSTVGIEAISRRKPVVVLGNSYYDNDKICLKMTDTRELRSLLKKSLNFHPNQANIIFYLHEIIFNFLIDGHFRDKEITVSRKISKEFSNDL